MVLSHLVSSVVLERILLMIRETEKLCYLLISALQLDAEFDLCVRYFCSTVILNYKENADAQASRVRDS